MPFAADRYRGCLDPGEPEELTSLAGRFGKVVASGDNSRDRAVRPSTGFELMAQPPPGVLDALTPFSQALALFLPAPAIDGVLVRRDGRGETAFPMRFVGSHAALACVRKIGHPWFPSPVSAEPPYNPFQVQHHEPHRGLRGVPEMNLCKSFILPILTSIYH